MSKTEREKGTYFEELIVKYFENDPSYSDLYDKVWMYSDWAKENGLDARDTGIDLVAKTKGTEELHAIQCKLYAEDYKLQKKDIDSFFTASGKKPFTRRIIVSTTNNWSEHADNALIDQQPPVTKIDLYALETSKIDWSKYQPQKDVSFKEKKQLRPHQERALNAVTKGLKDVDRGKLIMACGTGKTFTSLKIAEAMAGKGGKVLFLVPSLALLSQTLTEWTQETATPIHSYAVCSDSDVGKNKKQRQLLDEIATAVHELQYPATTNAKRLSEEFNLRYDDAHMNVVFSTYHSIDVINKAQKENGFPEFDLIICDEAHRTTGATFEGEDESNFVKVHDSEFIKSNKRLYMTATPRIYAEAVKKKAEDATVTLASMDDEKLYGKELFVINFSEAVRLDLLVDYKVIVLAVEESAMNRSMQALLADPENQLVVSDVAKIVGCWKGLAKQNINSDLPDDKDPMKRAVAFCQVIESTYKGKKHKVSSKLISEMFQKVVEEYQKSEEVQESERIICEAEHVDGSMNAGEKEEKLQWLKSEPPANTCRILSNVRCLSEGVDVPALDAVLFLTPRNSQVDVVQSVGRVMRKAEGKKRGYVILPVVIPAGKEPDEALNDNETYRVVWQVLQALRSHDDSFDMMINKGELVGFDRKKMEVVSIVDKVARKQKYENKENLSIGKSHKKGAIGGEEEEGSIEDFLKEENIEITKAIYEKIVKKCGNRLYWAEWAEDIAKIARTHIDRIHKILEDEKNTEEIKAFNAFAEELRDDLNDSITNDEIIEMLAQHLITKPVFDALFEGYSFAGNNPISQAMQSVLDALQAHHIDKEAHTLKEFYESVKRRAAGIENAHGKQKIVVELYDKFFRNAFPRMTERLGIVYTPVEVVDFIIHSVNDILMDQFGTTLGEKGVHIIDPFTGTGTFITRLLQSGLITKEQLPHKYKEEIHANELVLLAYYIAAINIEAVYHGIMGGEYQPFEGICLTDTFQMYEKDDMISDLLADNSDRRIRQKELDIRVIMGNPPYSAKQESANDNNANIAYPELDKRIQLSYAEKSKATNKNALYDSYIRAIRWASDRIGNCGVIGFVTNAGFIESNTADGMRKCLADEFSDIYIFHLRGNARTQGEQRRKEKGNVFGEGSRSPIAISFLVKNPEKKEHGSIYIHDIGDYLSREEKLSIISDLKSIKGISKDEDWQNITPNEHGDWLNQRDDSFNEFIKIGDKKDKNSNVIFENYSNGLKTQRDVWCYNSSSRVLSESMQKMISFYNSEIDLFNSDFPNADKKTREEKLDNFVSNDPTQISWTHNLKQDFIRNKTHIFDPENLTKGVYRPFSKQWLYYDRAFNERVYQIPHIFSEQMLENIVIGISGLSAKNGLSVFSTNIIPDLNMLEAGAQCFPLYLYEKVDGDQPEWMPEEEKGGGYVRRDAITDEGLEHFTSYYKDDSITKEDLFYYIYGLLHSPEYREKYADNLSKELPRIPRVKKLEDFKAFAKAGRELADLHINYETVEKYPVTIESKGDLSDSDYRVVKMKYGKKGKDEDNTTIIYNDRITLRNIPSEAYKYIVNGKPAIKWVMERQGVLVDTKGKSGIVNDANDWAIETMNNPKYPLELLQRVITVSIKTMSIVNNLPKLETE
jgi:predicted helicase